MKTFLVIVLLCAGLLAYFRKHIAWRLLGAVALLCFAGCATDTGNASKDRCGRLTNAAGAELFNAVVRAGLIYGGSALAGQNGQDASHAAFLAATQVDAVAAFSRLEKAYAGPQVNPLVNDTLGQLGKLNLQTPADKQKALNIVGAAIQQVANQKFNG